jgi:hypothetical protein
VATEALISQNARSPCANNHQRGSMAGQSTTYTRIDDSAATGNGPPLTYSSPRPWVLGLSISAALWAGIGWGIWKVVS